MSVVRPRFYTAIGEKTAITETTRGDGSSFFLRFPVKPRMFGLTTARPRFFPSKHRVTTISGGVTVVQMFHAANEPIAANFFDSIP